MFELLDCKLLRKFLHLRVQLRDALAREILLQQQDEDEQKEDNRESTDAMSGKMLNSKINTERTIQNRESSIRIFDCLMLAIRKMNSREAATRRTMRNARDMIGTYLKSWMSITETTILNMYADEFLRFR